MLIKRSKAEITEIIDEEAAFDDEKTRKALAEAKNEMKKDSKQQEKSDQDLEN